MRENGDKFRAMDRAFQKRADGEKKEDQDEEKKRSNQHEGARGFAALCRAQLCFQLFGVKAQVGLAGIGQWAVCELTAIEAILT